MLSVAELKGSVGQILHNDKSVAAVEQNKVLIPPAFNKYLAWGFADMSVRIGNYDSDKVGCMDIGQNGDKSKWRQPKRRQGMWKNSDNSL